MVNGDITGSITNRAEIAADDSDQYGTTDVDSIPDDTNFNGPGETTNNADDVIDQDGKNGGDEDDHDQASIDVSYYDLALTKKVITA